MFVAWILIVIFRIILCSNMKRLIGIFCLLVMGWTGAEAERLSLDDAIPDGAGTSRRKRSGTAYLSCCYWSYRSFRANYLPEVSLTSTPYLNRQINRVTQPDGTEQFLRQNQLSTDVSLSVSQNIWFTGGNLFLQTSAQRMDEFGDHTEAYNTQPVTIGYQQSLFGYNSLKWDRRIEPVRFREARSRTPKHWS